MLGRGGRQVERGRRGREAEVRGDMTRRRLVEGGAGQGQWVLLYLIVLILYISKICQQKWKWNDTRSASYLDIQTIPIHTNIQKYFRECARAQKKKKTCSYLKVLVGSGGVSLVLDGPCPIVGKRQQQVRVGAQSCRKIHRYIDSSTNRIFESLIYWCTHIHYIYIYTSIAFHQT